MEELGVLIVLLVQEAVVGYDDDQQVVPLRQLPEAVHQQSDAVVGIGKGIELLVCQAVIGDHPGLVAADGLPGQERRLQAVHLRYEFTQLAACNVVIGSPCCGDLLGCEIVVVHQTVERQVLQKLPLAHVGHGACVEIGGAVALLFQCTRQAGKERMQRGVALQAYVGMGHMSCKRTGCAPVGTE